MDDKSTTILLSIISILFFIISAIDDVTAQNQLAVKPSPPQADDDSATDFQPSLAVVIALLSIMFSLTFILLLYAKFRRRRSSSLSLSRRIIQDGLLRRPAPPPSGVEKSVVESLPLFRFSSLRGPTEGLECAVCLAQFDGTDVLRMLPKCKHAFHIDCIDRWLEKRDTCPLCRRRAEPDDVVGSDLQYCSEGFPWDPPDHHGYSNLELHVEREEYSSSFGSKPQQEQELPIQINNTNTDTNTDNNQDRIFHKLNHKINVVSSVNNVLKNRWSDVSSSDMLHLNSEMLGDVSNSRFANSSNSENSRKNDYSMMNNIKEEMERKRLFESKVKEIKNHTRIVVSDCSKEKRDGLESDTRSASEIKVHPRFRDQVRNISGNSDSVDEEEVMRRRVWLQIARRTIQWFANREEPRPSTQINV